MYPDHTLLGTFGVCILANLAAGTFAQTGLFSGLALKSLPWSFYLSLIRAGLDYGLLRNKDLEPRRSKNGCHIRISSNKELNLVEWIYSESFEICIA